MLAVAQQALLVENGLVFEHGINGSGDLMGKDGQRLGFVVFVGLHFHPGLRLGVATQEQNGGFRKGPFEESIADFPAAGAVGFSGRFFFTFDQAAVGDKILNTGKAMNIIDFKQDDQ